MRIEQALDFINSCPHGKFETLSDLLSPELVGQLGHRDMTKQGHPDNGP